MDMSVLLAITCEWNLVLYCMKSNVYDGLSTDLFTLSELPISHPVYYARIGTTVQGQNGVTTNRNTIGEGRMKDSPQR